MLKQSFSTENFRNILDYENRKGNFLEKRFFTDLLPITDEIKRLTIEIRARNINRTPEVYDLLTEQREKLKDIKEQKLTKFLNEISEKVITGNFQCTLTNLKIEGWKPMFKIDGSAETYFTIKQVQRNIHDIYKVKQANRIEIVSQVKTLLNDIFPKVIIRTDLEDFYESVPHQLLIRKINEDNLLDHLSKQVIRNLLFSYREITGGAKGIPRGVGVSAYLAELYMKDIDKEIKSLPHLVYYGRYVDDIIAMFSPVNVRKQLDYKASVKDVVESNKYSLKLNENKTEIYSTITQQPSFDFTFLGYKIIFNHSEHPNFVSVRFSQKKLDKYKTRIEKALVAYNNESLSDQRTARRLLLKRIKFLTGNTRLINNKSNIIVGIYYSNILINSDADLNILDGWLKEKVDQYLIQEKLKDRLISFSFHKGFHKKTYVSFKSGDFNKVLKVWNEYE